MNFEAPYEGIITKKNTNDKNERALFIFILFYIFILKQIYVMFFPLTKKNNKNIILCT